MLPMRLSIIRHVMEYPYLSVYIRLYIRKGIGLLLSVKSKGIALRECGINERMKWSGTRECS